MTNENYYTLKQELEQASLNYSMVSSWHSVSYFFCFLSFFFISYCLTTRLSDICLTVWTFFQYIYVMLYACFLLLLLLLLLLFVSARQYVFMYIEIQLIQRRILSPSECCSYEDGTVLQFLYKHHSNWFPKSDTAAQTYAEIWWLEHIQQYWQECFLRNKNCSICPRAKCGFFVKHCCYDWPVQFIYQHFRGKFSDFISISVFFFSWDEEGGESADNYV